MKPLSSFYHPPFFRTLAILTLVLPVDALADVITLSPTDVNRIFGNTSSGSTYANTHYSDVFSTYGQPSLFQKTLVLTTGADFLAAIETKLGTSEYTINSVTLTVGSSADSYVSTGDKNAYLVLTSYDHSTVTWNTFNAGGVQGVDYSSVAASTGVVTGDVTTWTFSSSLIQDWINGTSTNYGLYFPDAGSESAAEYTANGNVVWTLDVTAIPEPSSVAFFGLGALGFALYRRKRAALL